MDHGEDENFHVPKHPCVDALPVITKSKHIKVLKKTNSTMRERSPRVRDFGRLILLCVIIEVNCMRGQRCDRLIKGVLKIAQPTGGMSLD